MAQEAPAPKLGTPEYDQAMAEKFRASKTDSSPLQAATSEIKPEAPAEKPARPENVPEKFWDAEKGQLNTDALLKSYVELEKGKGQPQEVQTAESDKAAAEAAEKAGLDYGSLHNKIVTDGKLADTDYAALAKIGITKDVVDSYVEAVQYKVAGEQAKAVEYIGGQADADKLIGWAAANLSEAEKAQYNTLLAGPEWRVAVDALKAKQAAASPLRNDPKLAGGLSSPAPGVVGFASRADMTAAMSDPRYYDRTSVGEAYRQDVYRKASISPWNRK